MPKRQADFIIQQMAEGTIAERQAIKEESNKIALELKNKMPTEQTDRLMYIRNIVEKAKAGLINMETFKTFIKMTNSWNELNSILNPKTTRRSK